MKAIRVVIAITAAAAAVTAAALVVVAYKDEIMDFICAMKNKATKICSCGKKSQEFEDFADIAD